jgi:two-component system phosphate regulon response regulator OmpR
MEEKPHILIVDDDRRLRELLRKYLADHGFLVTTAKDAAEARSILNIFVFDLIILDVMMPGEDGLSLCTSLAKSNGPPVLLLTAMAESEDRIKGLENGAEDYLTKPFEPRELLLRIGTILRRKPVQEPASQILKLGQFLWDCARQELRQGDEVVKLTTADIQLLALLADASGQSVSREDLATHTGTENNPRAVDVQVTRLRRKIEADPRQPRYLQTVRGQGYMLRPD